MLKQDIYLKKKDIYGKIYSNKSCGKRLFQMHLNVIYKMLKTFKSDKKSNLNNVKGYMLE